jgi:hypothetical protein
LRYPAGTLPEESIFATGGGGEITWCPLNYSNEPPRSEDVLEAERIDELLAMLHRMARLDRKLTPGAALERTALVDLARE